MNNILRIGIVGAPGCKKSALIDYLSGYLKDDYQIFVMTSTPSNLLKMGLNQGFIDDSSFEYDCLVEYVNDYNKLDRYVNRYKGSKNIVIIYDTLPSDGEIYLYHHTRTLTTWKEMYNDDIDLWNKHECNKIFLIELSSGEYGIVDSSKKYYDINQVLSIEELFCEKYKQAFIISNDNKTIEDKAQIIIDYINDYFKPTEYTINLNTSSIKVHQFCYVCGWEEDIEYTKQYKYCPMCGKALLTIGSITRADSLDPLGIEARNKMFYVDPEKLPKYVSYK